MTVYVLSKVRTPATPCRWIGVNTAPREARFFCWLTRQPAKVVSDIRSYRPWGATTEPDLGLGLIPVVVSGRPFVLGRAANSFWRFYSGNFTPCYLDPSERRPR